MEESPEITWLKDVLRQTLPSEDEPTPKRVKVTDIHQSLETKFAPSKYSHHAVSSLIQSAFPFSETKRAGKKRVMHVRGVDWVQQCETDSPAGSSKTVENTPSYQAMLLENRELTLKVRHLEERVRELKKHSSANLLSETAAVV